VGREAQARAGRFAEAGFLHAVQEIDRLAAAELLVAVGDDAAEVLTRQRQVVEGHPRVEDVVEDDPADGRTHQAAGVPLDLFDGRLFLIYADFADDLLVDRQAHADRGVHADALERVRREYLGGAVELHAVAGFDVVALLAAGRGEIV